MRGAFFLLVGEKLWIDYTKCSFLKRKLHVNEKKTQENVEFFKKLRIIHSKKEKEAIYYATSIQL